MKVGRSEEEVIEALFLREGRHVTEGIQDGVAVFLVEGAWKRPEGWWHDGV